MATPPLPSEGSLEPGDQPNPFLAFYAAQLADVDRTEYDQMMAAVLEARGFSLPDPRGYVSEPVPDLDDDYQVRIELVTRALILIAVLVIVVLSIKFFWFFVVVCGIAATFLWALGKQMEQYV